MDINTMDENSIMKMIEDRLKIDAREYFSRSKILQGDELREELEKEEVHRGFNMSGYDSWQPSTFKGPGACTLHNQSILNAFADLGIYDYSHYLVVDFYKGTPIIYLKYWGGEYYEEDYGGWGTTEIIYEVLKLTTLSGRTTRRRD